MSKTSKKECNQCKCNQCQFYDKKKKTRTEDCPNKDKTNFNFTTCDSFLINEKLVNF